MARARPQPHGDGHRLLVVEDQRRHGRSGRQPVPAVRSHRCLYGVAEVAEPLDVPPDGARADSESRRELAAGPFAGRLEEGQQIQQPCRSVGHATQSGADLGHVLAYMGFTFLRDHRRTPKEEGPL
ncbi:hypothetical protein GCM10020000_47190 [Streptomyces olivoverticillatus]